MLKTLFDIAPLAAEIEAGSLILTPNNRLASKMLDAWGLQQGQQAWRLPAIYAIENWITEQWQQLVTSALPGGDAVPLTPSQELLLWEQVIEADSDKPDLLNAAGLAHGALRAHQALSLWCVDNGELASYREPGVELLQRWRNHFGQRLQQLNAITRTELTGRLRDAYQQTQLPRRQRIVLVDFQTLAPLHRQLLHAAGSEVEEFPWPRATPASCSRAAFTDSQQELQQAALWARQQLEANPMHRVGIIIPDLPNRRQQVERVFRELFEPRYTHPDTPRYTAPFNISTATPLASTPLVAAALKLLKLNYPRQPLADYCALLNSPFWGDRDNQLAVRALAEKRLRELGRSQPRALDFRECCSDRHQGFAADALIRFENLRRRASHRASYPAWQQLFGQQLAILGWPGSRPADSVEYQQLRHWEALLEQFAALQSVAPQPTIAEALQQLERLAQTTPFQAETEDSPVQILGLLEGAGLRFDHLWMMGMDDRQWPPTPEPNPLLPIELQRRHNMPRASAERELELAGKLLHSYRNRADNQLFSYCRFDGDAELSASALIADIADAEFAPPITTAPQAGAELHPIGNGPALNPQRETVRGGSGLLKDQANCPFNAFARWRLGAQLPQEPGPGLSPLERGIILHDVLDALWEQLQDQHTLLATEQSQLTGQIEQIGLRALRRWRARKPELGDRYFHLEAERLNNLVNRWLDTERERPAFRVAAREAAIEANFAGLPMTLRIDRIDHSDGDGGGTVLIDYKTGNATIGGWLGDRPSEPQLPLYALLQPEPPTAISFAIINAEKQAMVGLTDNPSLIPNYKISRHYPVPESWHELLDRWRTTLTAVAESYCRGDAEITPYNRQGFAYQEELLPLNRWLERTGILRRLENNLENGPEENEEPVA